MFSRLHSGDCRALHLTTSVPNAESNVDCLAVHSLNTEPNVNCTALHLQTFNSNADPNVHYIAVHSLNAENNDDCTAPQF